MSISGLVGVSWPWKVFPTWTQNQEVISKAIYFIIMTSLGERKMNTRFGSEVQSLVFENKGMVLEALAGREISVALAEHLPAVEVLKIDVQEPEKDTDPVNIDVSYRYRGELNKASVTVPTA